MKEHALHGGRKAVQELGPFPTKIGNKELPEILSMWQFRPQTAQKLKKLIEKLGLRPRTPAVDRPRGIRAKDARVSEAVTFVVQRRSE
jgi:hypothetical protein